MKKLDLTGQVYGRWTALEYAGTAYWLCRCECGTERKVYLGNLRSGVSKSCGCLHKEIQRDMRWLGDQAIARHPLFGTWESMRSRCQRTSVNNYADYGGRGISIHQAWRTDFRAFAEWVQDNLGSRPVGHTLDRIDNDGNYEPGNLRWATKSQQSRNRRRVSPLQTECDLWRERALALGWGETTTEA